MKLIEAAIIAAVVAGPVAGAGEIAFTTKPAAVREGKGVKITFGVSAPTDVEVGILDAKSKMVRHLAAGVLGKNAPEPLKKGSLAQELVWDGNDDAGRPAKAGPFKVRVGLRLKPTFERIIGWSGQNMDLPRGMVCGPAGTLYAIFGVPYQVHRQTTLITAHNRDGKYLRQVFPGPANLPPEKRKGWPRIKLSDDEEVPVVFHQLSRSTYPGAVFGARVFPVVTRDGRLIVLSALYSGGGIKHPDVRGRRLLILGTDGSVPANYLGPVVEPGKLHGFGHLALSPDEKHVYIAGLFEREKRGLCQVVWRMPLDGSKPAEVFTGKLYQAGKGSKGLNDPQGLAVDKQGNLYVADYGNHRIAIFKPDGTFLEEIPVKFPDQVKVSKKTGSVYVLCIKERKRPFTGSSWGHWFNPNNWRAEKIVKFGGLRDKTRKAVFSNPDSFPHGGAAILALDDSGDKPILWYNVTGRGFRQDVLKIVDRGGELESLGGPIFSGIKKNAVLPFVGAVATHGNRLLVRHSAISWHFGRPRAYDVTTGASAGTYIPLRADNRWERYVFDSGDSVAGPDGRIYSHVMAKLWRHGADGKPAPFAGSDKHTVGGMHYGHKYTSGLFAARNGNVYIPAAPGTRKIEDMSLRVVGPDGKIKNPCAVRIQGAKIGGVAVDSRGNIYMGVKVALKGKRIPDWFRGKLPPDSKHHHPGYAYKQYGSVLKFPPTGGEVLKDPKGKYTADCYYKHSVSLKNVLWLRRSGYLPNHGHEAGCLCESTRFDIDAYDRLYVPDVFRFSVGVLDSAGNEIIRFGSYGNMDSRGPGSPVPVPEIAFGWPLDVKHSNGRVLVADLVNRRVVSVRITHAVVGECRIR